MAVTLRHRKTDTIADFTQAELDRHIANGHYPSGTTLNDIVLPSDWNDDHEMTELNSALDALSDLSLMLMGG